jgi:hypothetical protein
VLKLGLPADALTLPDRVAAAPRSLFDRPDQAGAGNRLGRR